MKSLKKQWDKSTYKILIMRISSNSNLNKMKVYVKKYRKFGIVLFNVSKSHLLKHALNNCALIKMPCNSFRTLIVPMIYKETRQLSMRIKKIMKFKSICLELASIYKTRKFQINKESLIQFQNMMEWQSKAYFLLRK